jgi:hypothetical protein
MPRKSGSGTSFFIMAPWWLVNEGLPDLTDVTCGNKSSIPIGGKVELVDGKQILLAKGDGGRLVVVQMVES